MKKLMLVEFCS
uniref:Uncharacterized protein n=1 Tax=Lepeophtheirus salmonis TaxID=72036 RepID=A0A0K2V5S9_LEPSM